MWRSATKKKTDDAAVSEQFGWTQKPHAKLMMVS